MLKVTRCAAPLASLILFTAGFAAIATTVEAVPSISPAGAARMEREKAEARQNTITMQKQAAPTQAVPRTECMRDNKATAAC
jgi:photosystem II stability/assembly factor-like uncharacterized protein